MKHLLIPLSFLIVIIALIYYLYDHEKANQAKAQGISLKAENPVPNNKVAKKQVKNPKIVSLKEIEGSVSITALELAQRMLLPDNESLRDIWQQAYGCPKQGDCLFATILTADSYEEALWMKRHGFPHFDQLSVAVDDVNYPYLEELASTDFKPALSLTAKILSSLGEHDEAMKRAVRYLEQSNREDIYAHRLMAEILAAKDPMNPYVIRDFQMAAILGDSEARRLAINYAENAEIMEAGMQLLLESLGYRYGLSKDLIPADPRP